MTTSARRVTRCRCEVVGGSAVAPALCWNHHRSQHNDTVTLPCPPAPPLPIRARPAVCSEFHRPFPLLLCRLAFGDLGEASDPRGRTRSVAIVGYAHGAAYWPVAHQHDKCGPRVKPGRTTLEYALRRFTEGAITGVRAVYVFTYVCTQVPRIPSRGSRARDSGADGA